MTIQLIISPNSIRQSVGSNTKNIFGEIYFQLNHDLFFPEKDWDDFIVIILNWWIEQSISSSNGSEAVCRFMDGPYYFTLKSESDSFDIVFISNIDKEKIIYSINMKQKDFFTLLVKNTNIILREAMGKNISSEDIIELERSFKSLQRFICTI